MTNDNVMNDIDSAWEILMANKKEVRVAVQVSPAVRVAIGEAFGLRKGEDALGKLASALRILGVDLVLDGAIAEDAVVYQVACEVKDRLQNGGRLPVVYFKNAKWAKKALEQDAIAPYVLSTRPAMQALAVAIKKRFLGDGKRTYVIAIVPCLAKKEAAAFDGLRQGGLPAVDLALTTVELVDILRSADLDLKYIPASPCDELFGQPSGCGYIAEIGGGVAEGVLRSVAEEQSAESVRRIEYSGVRGNKAIRIAESNVNAVVVAGDENVDKILQDVAGGMLDCAFVEVVGKPLGCAAGCGQPEADENTCRLRAYGLYCLDKRAEVRVPEAAAATVALAKNFALDLEDDGFAEVEASLSPFEADEVVVAPVVEAPAEEESIVEETPLVEEESIVEEEPIVEETPLVEEVVEVVEIEEVPETPAVEEADEVEEAPAVEEADEVEETPAVEEADEVEEAPAVEEVVEDPIVEEAAVEEAVEEVIEEVVEEAVEEVEEAPVEEVEEAPVEEVEEAPVEAVEEAPVEAVEEAPVEAVEEAPVEETVEEAEEIYEVEEEAEEVAGSSKYYHPNFRRMSKTERRKLKRAKKK